MIEVFGRELEQYFDFRGNFDKISDRESADGSRYGVYLTDIKREFRTLAPGSSVVIKELTALQAENYDRLFGVWNPYLEVIYGVLEKDGAYISVNEFVEAPGCLNCENRSLNLEEYIIQFGCLPERVALMLLWQLCEALRALEKIHLTHGDISPQNIVLTDAHQWDKLFMPQSSPSLPFSVKLIDFGISREVKQMNHLVTAVMGTKPFAAPEILDYRYPSDRVDIYSLGCILHYMITGKSPKEWKADGKKKLMSRGTRRIIEGCTAGYSARYHNVSKLQKEILRQFLAGGKFSVLSYIPGFRSRGPWKMAVASCTYVYFGVSIILAFVADGAHFLQYALIAAWFCLELILVFDVFHLGNLSKVYMEYRQNFPPLKYFVKFVAGLFALVLLSMFIAY